MRFYFYRKGHVFRTYNTERVVAKLAELFPEAIFFAVEGDTKVDEY